MAITTKRTNARAVLNGASATESGLTIPNSSLAESVTVVNKGKGPQKIALSFTRMLKAKDSSQGSPGLSINLPHHDRNNGYYVLPINGNFRAGRGKSQSLEKVKLVNAWATWRTTTLETRPTPVDGGSQVSWAIRLIVCVNFDLPMYIRPTTGSLRGQCQFPPFRDLCWRLSEKFLTGRLEHKVTREVLRYLATATPHRRRFDMFARIPVVAWAIIFSVTPALTKCGNPYETRASLRVHNKYLSPDGFNRSATVVNGVHPAPLITAKKGDNFKIDVSNNLEDPTMMRGTSVHWHGLLQYGTTWADGSASVSQCPISPGNMFQYRFSGGKDRAGTFWYHSHFGTQYCDGLRGPMVVYDENDPYKWLYDIDDENTVITLADWYHTPAPSLVMPAFADSTLINGKGRAPGGPKTELAIVNVIQGKRYRFRLVSIACENNFQFSIDGHGLTIIEADGFATEPVTVDRLQIFAGQRYSFVLKANQPVGNYWIRALPNFGNNGLTLGFQGGINSAVLRYARAATAEPTTSALINPVQLVETALRGPTAPGKPVPGGADVNLYLDLGLKLPEAKYTVNGTSFDPPSVPVLLQIMSGAKNAADLLPKGSIIPLPRNKVVEITVPGGLVGGPHPFHLHGHAFSVIKSAGSKKYNFKNPPLRDVVNTGDAGEDAVIRFVTDNPGPWFFHCHVELHLGMGLAVVFAEDTPKNILAGNPIPESWKELCPAWDALPESATSVSIVKPTGLPAVPV